MQENGAHLLGDPKQQRQVHAHSRVLRQNRDSFEVNGAVVRGRNWPPKFVAEIAVMGLGHPASASWRRLDAGRESLLAERHLTQNGTVVLKFFLRLSKAEQRRRFLTRLDDPRKELEVFNCRRRGAQSVEKVPRAYEDTMRHTATRLEPWYVVPAERRWSTRVVVGAAIAAAFDELALAFLR